MNICYYHVTCVFQNESTLYGCLNIEELLAQNRRDIWSLSDSNGIWTHNYLVREWTLNHLAKLAKWLSVHLRTKWLWVRILLLYFAKRSMEIQRYLRELEFPKSWPGDELFIKKVLSQNRSFESVTFSQ